MHAAFALLRGAHIKRDNREARVKSQDDNLRREMKTPKRLRRTIANVGANNCPDRRRPVQSQVAMQQRHSTSPGLNRGVREPHGATNLDIPKDRLSQTMSSPELLPEGSLAITIEPSTLLPRSSSNCTPPVQYIPGESVRTVRRISGTPSLFSQFNASVDHTEEPNTTPFPAMGRRRDAGDSTHRHASGGSSKQDEEQWETVLGRPHIAHYPRRGKSMAGVIDGPQETGSRSPTPPKPMSTHLDDKVHGFALRSTASSMNSAGGYLAQARAVHITPAGPAKIVHTGNRPSVDVSRRADDSWDAQPSHTAPYSQGHMDSSRNGSVQRHQLKPTLLPDVFESPEAAEAEQSQQHVRNWSSRLRDTSLSAQDGSMNVPKSSASAHSNDYLPPAEVVRIACWASNVKPVGCPTHHASDNDLDWFDHWDFAKPQGITKSDWFRYCMSNEDELAYTCSVYQGAHEEGLSSSDGTSCKLPADAIRSGPVTPARSTHKSDVSGSDLATVSDGRGARKLLDG